MTTRKRLNLPRLASLGLAGLLLGLLAGDGNGIAAAPRGIDPLDVLDLQVKPNVILVLDSSQSMRETLISATYNADWRQTKMGLAKKVLRDVVSENVATVNFLFGIYRVSGGSSTMANTDLDNDAGHFKYMTFVDWNDLDDDGVFEPAAATPETAIEGLDGTSWITACVAPYTTQCELTLPGRGFQAWQWITTGWNHLYYQEAGAGSPICDMTITPGFYATGAALATELQTKMNACTGRLTTTQTYTVTYNTGNGRFTFAISGTFRRNSTLRFNAGANNIAGAISATSGTTGTPEQPTYAAPQLTSTSLSYTTNDSIRLLWRSATGFDNEETNFDPDGQGILGLRDRITYQFNANMFFNGELLYVKGDGSLCNVDFASPVKTDPPTLRFQQLSDCANLTSTVGPVVKVEFAGAQLAASRSNICLGFQTLQALVPCTQDPAPVAAAIASQLRPEFPFDQTPASATFGQLLGYSERTDGTHQMISVPSVGGLRTESATPIANSLIDIKGIFTTLWDIGQADVAATTTVNESRAPIKNQTAPREKTIVLFVTDGDDTCPSLTGGFSTSNLNDHALRAAHKAEQLYAPVLAGDQDSSVTTYVIGFGTGASSTRLDWVAWGGSGLGQGTGTLNVGTSGSGELEQWSDSATTIANKRALCTTCVNAFIAPDANTLAAQIRSILSQGVGSGEFTAQQALFIPVFELVKEFAGADPDSPANRYLASVPNLFRSTFDLPGFKGQLRAFQQSGGVVSVKWSAGQKLFDRVRTSMLGCVETSGTSTPGECLFSSLRTRIDRRIYTTSGNGVFPATVGNLTDDSWLTTDGNRKVLWPATTLIAPDSNTTAGDIDIAMGLPMANNDPTFAELQSKYGACRGTGLAAACSAAQPARTQRARREAREVILAHMAGATPVLVGNDPKRATGTELGNMLFARRDWLLADSTLATAAAVQPPTESVPDNTGFENEYLLMRDGFRDSTTIERGPTYTGLVVDASGASTRIGFGLRNPDKDADHDGAPVATEGQPASDLPNLKPSMTVVYSGANDMLHAYRAGPNCNVPGSTAAPFLYPSCDEQGGDELWGFVPYDQLSKLPLLVQPQTRANHVYMIASAMRFGDVFVPNPGSVANPSGTTFPVTVGGVTRDLKGLWRRMLVFGRGYGGKHYSALDITTAGTYKTLAIDTVPPVPLWNRGNPDTNDGTPTGTNNNTAGDRTAYSRMGETWSVPALVYVDSLAVVPSTTVLAHKTTNKSSGVSFVLITGSGYGDRSGCPSAPCEGTSIFSLDALTGDVIEAPDVGGATPLPTGGYDNAIVASVAAYNPLEFTPLNPPHPAAVQGAPEPVFRRAVTRVYVGDLHGRLWKVDTNDLATPVLLSDFGVEQPIAAAVGLLGLQDDPALSNPPQNGMERVPHVYVTTGFDIRQDPAVSGAFVLAGIKDNDPVGAPTVNCVVGAPVPPCLFVQEMVQVFGGDTGFFRGTVQPATFSAATALASPDEPDVQIGRVLFASTRFNDPNSPFAPVPCSAQSCAPAIPCRSSFDSAVYALGARSGSAAFDLNAGVSGVDDSFVIFDNSKIVGISILSAPDGGGNPIPRVFIDEGLNRGSSTPDPGSLPESGRAQTTAAGSGGVATQTTRLGSVVCQ